MADIVLGVGTSHSPQLNIPVDQWDLLVRKDEEDPALNYSELLARAPAGIAERITPQARGGAMERAQVAIRSLAAALETARPDVVLVIGDDQHELFSATYQPMFCIFAGPSTISRRPFRPNAPAWLQVELATEPVEPISHPGHPELALYLIDAVIAEGFDVAVSLQWPPDIGLGHAFSFLYRRLTPRADLPMVPVMVNTFYPPNQPSPARCLAFGRALGKALRRWPSSTRVAVVASGGLSHVALDEDLDHSVLRALETHDEDALCRLPEQALVQGTSEIRNWLVAAGMFNDRRFRLVDYVPAYRSPAATGTGFAFALWE
ncbi:MAG: hypothetical protein K6U87_02300 [Firmicutes bacterium]|nr:hypothetical protein [Bacillota bacterium]